jgi:hypothetical protein
MDINNQFLLIDKIVLSDAEGNLSLGKLEKTMATKMVASPRNDWDVKIRSWRQACRFCI